MAIFNEILSARFARFNQKLFGMKGGPPVRALGGELMAVIQHFNGVENRYLESWARFGLALQQAGLAAANSGIRIRNPSTSGAIIVLEKILYSNEVGTPDTPLLQQGPMLVDLATVVSVSQARWDPRGNPQPTAIVSTGNTAPSIGTVNKLSWQSNAAAAGGNNNLEIIVNPNQEIPVLPGEALQILSTAVNIQLNVSYWWRERALEDSEKT